MKWLIIGMSLFSPHLLLAEDSIVVCGPSDITTAASPSACQLGHRVVQGILLKNQKTAKFEDANELVKSLRSEKLSISREKYEKAELKEKANIVFNAMAKKAGQTSGPANAERNSIIEKARRPSVMSTGTRGGGFDEADFNLQLDLWY